MYLHLICNINTRWMSLQNFPYVLLCVWMNQIKESEIWHAVDFYLFIIIIMKCASVAQCLCDLDAVVD